MFLKHTIILPSKYTRFNLSIYKFGTSEKMIYPIILYGSFMTVPSKVQTEPTSLVPVPPAPPFPVPPPSPPKLLFP